MKNNQTSTTRDNRRLLVQQRYLFRRFSTILSIFRCMPRIGSASLTLSSTEKPDPGKRKKKRFEVKPAAFPSLTPPGRGCCTKYHQTQHLGGGKGRGGGSSTHPQYIYVEKKRREKEAIIGITPPPDNTKRVLHDNIHELCTSVVHE